MSLVFFAACIALLAVITWGPGLACLHFLGVPPRHSWSLAPAWSIGIYTACALAFHTFKIPFAPLPVFAAVLVCVAVSWLIGRRLVSERSHLTREHVVFAAIAALFAFITWLPLVYGHDLATPPQQNDTTFHLAAVLDMLRTGDASPISAFNHLYGLNSVSVFYPAAWHQIVSLSMHVVPTSVVAAAKAMQVVIILVWLAGLGSCARAALPRIPHAPLIALALAQLVAAFPTYTLAIVPLWPNSLGVALLPGVLAATFALARNLHRHGLAYVRTAPGAISATTTILGAAAMSIAYPSMYFSWVLALIALAAIGVGRAGVGTRKTLLSRIVILGIALAAFALPFATGPIRSMLVPGSDATWANAAFKLFSLFTLWPFGGGPLYFRAGAALLGVLMCIGAVIALKHRAFRCILAVHGAFLLIVLASLFPLGPLSRMTGVWYFGAYRTEPVLAITWVILAVLSADLILRRVPRGPRFLTCLTLAGIVFATLGWGVRADGAHRLYSPERGSTFFMADSGELAMTERAQGTLDHSKLVLGDPSNGSVLMQFNANMPVVYKQIAFGSVKGADADSRYLADHFADIHSDPHVCELVRKYNIGYFYEDVPRYLEGKLQSVGSPGLYSVDTSSGFELVDSGGTARLYAITACG